MFVLREATSTSFAKLLGTVHTSLAAIKIQLYDIQIIFEKNGREYYEILSL